MPADAMSPLPAPGLGSGRMTWAGRLSAADPGLGRLRLGMLGTVTAAAALGAEALLAWGKEGSGMHRTDTIDLVAVLEGETNVAYPGEDGGEHEITIRTGDFLTHNGTFHRWHNRSGRTCTLLCITIAAGRELS
jgi:uncharacterized cupin superfamily protein